MHELALSESIAATVLRECGVSPEKVRKIGLEVGALSGVNVASLEFCMRVVLDQRGMEEASAEIAEMPARCECACGRTYQTTDMFEPCPDCGGFDRDIVAGTDLTIQYVEVEDEQD
jgi:hydrogenase nickel incorporation protein HypA/HybF